MALAHRERRAINPTCPSPPRHAGRTPVRPSPGSDDSHTLNDLARMLTTRDTAALTTDTTGTPIGDGPQLAGVTTVSRAPPRFFYVPIRRGDESGAPFPLPNGGWAGARGARAARPCGRDADADGRCPGAEHIAAGHRCLPRAGPPAPADRDPSRGAGHRGAGDPARLRPAAAAQADGGDEPGDRCGRSQPARSGAARRRRVDRPRPRLQRDGGQAGDGLRHPTPLRRLRLARIALPPRGARRRRRDAR